MLEHTIERIRPTVNVSQAGAIDGADHAEKIKANINELYAKSRQGLWRMAGFMLISMLALLFRDINILAPLPENIRSILGNPPSPSLVTIVLAVSTVSTLIIIAGHFANEAEPAVKRTSLAYRSIFYLFYLFSNTLDQYFLLVFFAGMAVLTAEHYHAWSYYTKAIRNEKALLKKLSMWPFAIRGE